MSIGSIFNGIATAFLGVAAQKSSPAINNYFQGRRERALPGTSIQTSSSTARSRQIPSSPVQAATSRTRQLAQAPNLKRRLRNQPANFGPQNQVDPLLALISQANNTGAVS